MSEVFYCFNSYIIFIVNSKCSNINTKTPKRVIFLGRNVFRTLLRIKDVLYLTLGMGLCFCVEYINNDVISHIVLIEGCCTNREPPHSAMLLCCSFVYISWKGASVSKCALYANFIHNCLLLPSKCTQGVYVVYDRGLI